MNLAADAGFRNRQKVFLQEQSSTVYSGDPVTFYGPIYHDLISCEAGVPPGKRKKAFEAYNTSEASIFFSLAAFCGPLAR